MIRTPAAALLLAGGLLLTPEAAAHSPFPGIKGLYSGFLHPLTQPAQGMLLLALGLLLASRADPGRPTAAATMVIAAAGGLLTGVLRPGSDDTLPLIVLVTAACLPVLMRWSLPGWVLVGLAAAAGGALGTACAPDPGAWQDVVITSLGAWLGLVYFAAMITGAMVAARRRWPGHVLEVATRIVAAWLMTVAMLYAALWWYGPDASLAGGQTSLTVPTTAGRGHAGRSTTPESPLWNTRSSASSPSTCDSL